MTAMSRAELLSYLSKAQNIDPKLRALAMLGINSMSDKKLAPIAEIAQEVKERVDAGDVDGMMAIVDRLDIPPFLRQAIDLMVAPLKNNAASNNPNS